ncbi:hypothetical protein JK359_35850 [Streptomyces actinomycinicus]|uniref:Uncharacterized protein n=1 Tax=Streptomyces actinomycinicus TaxID=1695166 RepID=A0A937ESL5_9ACTN|nr:hypothetical protein [Streptomyces actinomycinicus]MBL1087274.1 hypothetical protein [Streptomyces actinomycinicus]
MPFLPNTPAPTRASATPLPGDAAPHGEAWAHQNIVIAKQGGWAPHPKVLAGYLEVVDQWKMHALLGVLETGAVARNGSSQTAD